MKVYIPFHGICTYEPFSKAEVQRLFEASKSKAVAMYAQDRLPAEERLRLIATIRKGYRVVRKRRVK
jgi:hypothetical protein